MPISGAQEPSRKVRSVRRMSCGSTLDVSDDVAVCGDVDVLEKSEKSRAVPSSSDRIRRRSSSEYIPGLHRGRCSTFSHANVHGAGSLALSCRQPFDSAKHFFRENVWASPSPKALPSSMPRFGKARHRQPTSSLDSYGRSLSRICDGLLTIFRMLMQPLWQRCDDRAAMKTIWQIHKWWKYRSPSIDDHGLEISRDENSRGTGSERGNEVLQTSVQVCGMRLIYTIPGETVYCFCGSIWFLLLGGKR